VFALSRGHAGPPLSGAGLRARQGEAARGARPTNTSPFPIFRGIREEMLVGIERGAPMKTVAIVNPTAGYRRARRNWPHLLASLGGAGAEVATWWTERPGHAEPLAAQARREGFDRVVAVGGDGTLLEVVNGLWWEPRGPQPSVGLVPFGTGCDYVRSFDLGRTLRDQVITALGEATLRVSLGLVHLKGLDGQPRSRVFLNVLGLGFDARVIKGFRQQRLRLPGKTSYFLSGIRELSRLAHHRITGELNGRPLNTEAMVVVLGLGRYFGGGMMITPGASPQARHFQVVLGHKLSSLELLTLLPGIYTGKHLDHPRVTSNYAGQVKIVADPPALVEAEGELEGWTPLEATILPAALQVAAPSLARIFRLRP
jgi:diacylglycerol kinase (ATP)